MAFMEIEITQKGALYTCDCAKCGATLYAHEWSGWDINECRDAMEAGTLHCDQCVTGRADPETFRKVPRKHYAGRYQAPGYMDATDWSYGTNKRALIRELRDMYGEE